MKQRQLAVPIFHKITPIWDKCQREEAINGVILSFNLCNRM